MPRQYSNSYSRHKPSNRGYVTIRGKQIYLPGAFDSKESWEAYGRLMAEYRATGIAKLRGPIEEISQATVSDLTQSYRLWIKRRKRRAEIASQRAELQRVEEACAGLNDHYGSIPSDKFDVVAMETVVAGWLAYRRKDSKPLVRGTINKRIRVVRQIFSFAVMRGLVSPQVAERLKHVPYLDVDPEIPESAREKHYVSNSELAAIRPYVSRQVWAMILVLRLTGARPSEVCRMTLDQIDAHQASVWFYRPTHHKTAWKGKSRCIVLPAPVISILKPFLQPRVDDQPIFSPRDALAEWCWQNGRSVRSDFDQKDKRAPRIAYDAGSLGRAIKNGCKRAGVKWHAYLLRATFGTDVEERLGAQHAQIALGHSHASTFYKHYQLKTLERAEQQAVEAADLVASEVITTDLIYS